MSPQPWLEEIDIDGIKLRMTCMACPEQYDAVDGRGHQVGYLRLRFGRFTVEIPDVSGELVFEHKFEECDSWKGCFEDDERRHYLALAVRAIKRRGR